jgi:hypothetical protein
MFLTSARDAILGCPNDNVLFTICRTVKIPDTGAGDKNYESRHQLDGREERGYRFGRPVVVTRTAHLLPSGVEFVAAEAFSTLFDPVVRVGCTICVLVAYHRDSCAVSALAAVTNGLFDTPIPGHVCIRFG